MSRSVPIGVLGSEGVSHCAPLVASFPCVRDETARKVMPSAIRRTSPLVYGTVHVLRRCPCNELKLSSSSATVAAHQGDEKKQAEMRFSRIPEGGHGNSLSDECLASPYGFKMKVEYFTLTQADIRCCVLQERTNRISGRR